MPRTSIDSKKLSARTGQAPVIGIACVFFCHDGAGQILLAKRSVQARDEQGRWDNGGGSLDWGQTVTETVRREVREEYGAEAEDITFAEPPQDVFRTLPDGSRTHWLALVHTVKITRGAERNAEPHKFDDIGWFSADDLPQPFHSQLPRHLKIVRDAGLI